MPVLPAAEVLRREDECGGGAGRARTEAAKAYQRRKVKSQQKLLGRKCEQSSSLSECTTSIVVGHCDGEQKLEPGNVDTNSIDVPEASAAQRVPSVGHRAPETRHSAERLERAVRPESVTLANRHRRCS